MNYKVCTGCKRKLEATLKFFHKSKVCKFGVASRCISCTKEYRRLFYLKNKERLNLRSKKYHKENRDKIREYQKKYYKENKKALNARSKKYYWDIIKENR